jgi:hypothetical protein
VLIKVENVHVACRVINPSGKTISTSAKTKPIQTKSNPKTAFFWTYENILDSAEEITSHDINISSILEKVKNYII